MKKMVVNAELQSGSFFEQMQDRKAECPQYCENAQKKRIIRYWKMRSEEFLKQRRAELHSALAVRWMEQITTCIPSERTLKILDVGCGTGFFSILLAQCGHEVTGIDLTPEMVLYSRQLADEEGVCCKFQVMDAECLEFKDETFDVVISRNLTWTLPDAKKAYKEWCRTLKKGGLLINFDANYGSSDFSDTSKLPDNHAHHCIGDEMMQECEEIKRQLPISFRMRPAWDLNVLKKQGIASFLIDLGISKKIYHEKNEFYNPTPMFLLCGRKEA